MYSHENPFNEKSEDRDLATHRTELQKVKDEIREASKSKPPTICPILTIAPSSEGLNADCVKENCWFYHRKLKVCAFVHMAMMLHLLAVASGQRDTVKGLMDLAKKP